MGYAILDAEGGWIVNLVVWDGQASSWTPPPGTIAVPIEELDIANLPQRPEQE